MVLVPVPGAPIPFGEASPGGAPSPILLQGRFSSVLHLQEPWIIPEAPI